MFKIAVLPLFGAMAFTTAAQVHVPVAPVTRQAISAPMHRLPIHAAVTDPNATAQETITVYYSPLESTKVTRLVGFGMAYHMAIVYTDRAGHSFGASSGPSNSTALQTPANAVQAIVYMADEQPSSFGTLVSDPLNDHAFTKGGASDYYTQTSAGIAYPRAIITKGRDLSAQWSTILQTYAAVGALGLTYSPTSQNSNSLAGTALRRAGLAPAFSSDTVFAPGVFTRLPIE